MPYFPLSHESARLQALNCYRLLDTPPEPEFDRITALAARIFNAPIAIVSLIDADRGWFKSRQGLELSEVPREIAFCDYTIQQNRPLVVPDATLDERFAGNPMVTGPRRLRFYAGAPLSTGDGLNLGSLCVIDTVPRAFTASEEATLTELAAVAMAAIGARLTEQRLRREIAVHEETTRGLREMEMRYGRISENTPGMVYQFIQRADGRAEFPFVSEACRELLGVEPAALLRDAGEYLDLIHPDDRAGRQTIMEEAVAASKPVRWEGRHVLASGEIKWLQTSSQPERMPSGDVFWDGVILDVTERRRADRRLRLLESSMDNANDAILITEAEPIDLPGPRIIYANRAFTEASGYSQEDIIGQTPRILQGPGTDPATRAAIRDALRRWEPVRVELLNYRKDGSEFWVELNIVPVANERGWWTHWVSVQRDMTERRRELLEQRRAGEALQQAKDDAERANSAKSEFLSRMSHELRTPLNAILGFGQLLEMSNPNPKQLESISHVLHGGRHLLDLINEVLDIARIEAGKIELNFVPVHVATLLQEVAALVRPLATPRSVTLNIAPAEQLLDGVMVRADQQRLRQILLNLFSNAIKYNRPSGRVDVSCRYADVAGRLRLTIRDTGPGINPANLGKLFSPFERLDAGKGQVEGTGIGLAISKRLAEAMSGSIDVESAVGAGSAFTLEMPIASGALEEPAAQIEETVIPALEMPPAGSRKTVLYIEDNLSNLKLVEQVLALRPGIKLLSAMRGEAGLELARECPPDLILMDVHLPDVGGDALLETLKEDPEIRKIPVIAVSADATPTQIQRLLRLGALSYLTKPLDVRAFLRTVDDALENG